MSKRWFLIAPLSVILSLLFIWWGIAAIVQLKAIAFLEQASGGNASFRHLEHQNDRLVFHSLRLEDKRGRTIEFPELDLVYNISWLSRKIHLGIYSKGAQIFLPKGVALLPTLFLFEEPESSIFQIEAAVEVEAALVKTDQFQLLTSLKGEFYKDKKEFQFSLKEEDKTLSISGEMDPMRSGFSLLANRFDLDRLLLFVKKIPAVSIEELQGTADGELHISLEGAQYRTSGKLLLENIKSVSDRGSYSSEKIVVDWTDGAGRVFEIVRPLQFVLNGEEGTLSGKITGSILRTSPYEFKVLSSSEVQLNEEGVRRLSQEGRIKVASKNIWEAATSLRVESESELNSAIYQIEVQVGKELQDKIELRVKGGNPQDFLIVETAAQFFGAKVPKIAWDRGRLDGAFTISSQGGQITELSGSDLEIRDFSLEVSDIESAFSAKRVAGTFVYDPRIPDIHIGARFDLVIEDGEVSLLPMGKWGQFYGINAHFILRNGLLEAPSAQLVFAGLRGALSVEKGGGVLLSLEGFGREIADLLPAKLGEILRRKSASEFVKINLFAEEIDRGLLCKGFGEILREGEAKDRFDLGFILSFKRESGFSPKDRAARQKILGKKAALGPGLGYFIRNWEKEIVETTEAIGGFQIDHGTLTFKNFDLGRMLSPYLFQKDEMMLSGFADIEMHFDDRHLILEYSGKGVRLESNRVLLTLPETIKKGVHFVDFISGHSEGKLPLARGTFVDKSYGIQFNDIEGRAVFVDKKIFLDALSGYSGSLFLESDLLVDLTDPREGVFDLFLTSKLAQGEVLRVREILRQIDPTLLFSEIPLEGGIGLRGNGGTLSFHVEPDTFTWTGLLSGTVFDAKLESPKIPQVLSGINFNFDYNRSDKSFRITDLVAEASQATFSDREFTIIGRNIGFSQNAATQAVVDVTIYEKDAPFFSLLAEGNVVKKEGRESIVWSFKEGDSSFGVLTPKDISLSTRGFERVDQFKLHSSFRLSDVIHELSRFSSSGLFFLSPELISPLLALSPISGEVDVHLDYEGAEAKLSFNLTGDDLSLGEKTIKKMAISGYYDRERWVFESISLDDLGISFTIDPEKDARDRRFYIKPFAIHAGNSLVLGGEGFFDPTQNQFVGTVELFQVRLEEALLRGWISDGLAGHSIEGLIRAKGPISLKNEESSWQCSANLSAEIKNFLFDQNAVEVQKPFKLILDSSKKALVEDLDATLVFKDPHESRVRFQLKEASVDLNNFDKKIDGLHFSSNVERVDLFAALFGEEISFSEAKRIGGLSGGLEGRWGSFGKDLEITLDGGTYQLFSLDISCGDQKIKNEGLRWWLHGSLFPEDPLLIEAVTSENSFLPLRLSFYEPGQEEKLEVFLQKEQEKFQIHTYGSTRGLEVNLNSRDEDDPDSLAFEGEVRINFQEAKRWAGREFQEKIEAIGLGSGWRLQGQWVVTPSRGNQENDFLFHGNLIGEEALIKGVFIDTLHGDIEIRNGKAQLRNIVGLDPAFHLQIPYIDFVKDESDIYCLNTPRIEITDIRPSLLYRLGAPRPESATSALVIEYLVIDDLKGCLDPITDLKGNGSLHFENPTKSNLRNTIFILPIEILSRIGIDMAALTPVTGTISFEIKDGVVLFNKFKQMYSYNKLSKFYLPSDGKSSWMDFDGNLSLEIKMRQHTLLFKLAELFTFSVRGTLDKPVYSISRGKYAEERLMDEAPLP